MPLIHHVVTGTGEPTIVFVHGFACSHTDWDGQVAHLARRYRTVAVDLRGHGSSPGSAAACSIAQYAADVAALMRELDLPAAVLVGHSMGCRVVVEAALQAADRMAGVVLVDGSQFTPMMEATLNAAFATETGTADLLHRWFQDMFTAKSDPARAAAVTARAARLPIPIARHVMMSLLRHDVGRLTDALSELTVPVMAVQTTYSNERRERRSLRPGQTTPYLAMLKARIPSVRIEIIADTGHFPQLDESDRTNALLDSFVTALPRR